MAITVYEKERMLKTLKHWYQSHKQSMAHYQETDNDNAVNYHQNQLNTIKWMANVIHKLETIKDYNLDDDNTPF